MQEVSGSIPLGSTKSFKFNMIEEYLSGVAHRCDTAMKLHAYPQHHSKES